MIMGVGSSLVRITMDIIHIDTIKNNLRKSVDFFDIVWECDMKSLNLKPALT